jgi:tetratricopeptide (TPR) repeat protein
MMIVSIRACRGVPMRKLLIVLFAVFVPIAALAQSPAELQARQLFEAGRYPDVIALGGPMAEPSVVYLAGRSQQRTGAAPAAAATFQRLADRPETDAWHFIGMSARQLIDGALDPALASAQQAVVLADTLATAHFQLGLVQAARQAWPEAAGAFDRAVERDPRMAYAHYFGALMYSRAGQPAQMAVRLEQFLRLAPEAPERPEVAQLMRTTRR